VNVELEPLDRHHTRDGLMGYHFRLGETDSFALVDEHAAVYSVSRAHHPESAFVLPDERTIFDLIVRAGVIANHIRLPVVVVL
jgi:hypothetical protein